MQAGQHLRQGPLLLRASREIGVAGLGRRRHETSADAVQRGLPQTGACRDERGVSCRQGIAGLQHDLLVVRQHLDAVRHGFEVVEQRYRRAGLVRDLVGVHHPVAIRQPRDPADNRAGNAERDGVETRHAADIARERVELIGERGEIRRGVSEEMALRGPGLCLLEKAEQRLGAAHIAGQNHLCWIIVKPA